jgi:hypothetical protein
MVFYLLPCHRLGGSGESPRGRREVIAMSVPAMTSQRCPCCSSTSSTSLLPPTLPPLALSLLSRHNTTSSTSWFGDVRTGADHIIGRHASHHCHRHLTRGQAAIGGHHLASVAKYVCWHKCGVCVLGTSGSSPCAVTLRGRFKLLSLIGIVLLRSHEDCREQRGDTCERFGGESWGQLPA